MSKYARFISSNGIKAGTEERLGRLGYSKLEFSNTSFNDSLSYDVPVRVFRNEKWECPKLNHQYDRHILKCKTVGRHLETRLINDV